MVGVIAGRHHRRAAASQNGRLRLYRDQVRNGIRQRGPAEGHAKEHRREQIRRAVRATADAGIAAKVFIIHGFPGENQQTTDDTISLLTELAPDLARVSLFRFVPLPGTQVYASPDAYGITGTHLQPGWDGDWSAFHIHHNARRWWGRRPVDPG